MALQCPSCRTSIDLAETAAEHVVCPSCGSRFHVDHTSTADWNPRERRLGRFELLDLVGVGAFGAVYKARDPDLDRVVAIKVPRAGNLATPGDLDRFFRECRSVAQLRHPGLVPVYEVGQAEQVPYVVSEFVDGMTLTDVLSGQKPSPRESAELVAAVADALQYAHDHKVIHRDVKPGNILVQGGAAGALRLEAPRLMDFGLAKRDAGDITMTTDGQVLGTPAYMSPEQARGEAHQVDGRADVYSLGVILYEMLTGELPFRGTPRMLLHQVLNEEPQPPRRLNDRIPRDLETICLKAMAKEPPRRYATARDLADDLRRFRRGEPILARPVRIWERAWRWAKRRPAAAALLAVSTVSLATLFVLAVILWQRAESEAALLQEKAEVALDLDAARKKLDDTKRDLAGLQAGFDGVSKQLNATQQQIEVQKTLLDQHKQQVAEAETEIAKARGELSQIHYARDLARAAAVWNSGNRRNLVPLLAAYENHALRGFEWEHLWRVAHAERWFANVATKKKGAWQGRIIYAADGSKLATIETATKKWAVRVWDAGSGKELGSFSSTVKDDSALGFAPDGNGFILVRSKPDGERIRANDGKAQDPKALGEPPSLKPLWDSLELVRVSFDGREAEPAPFDARLAPETIEWSVTAKSAIVISLHALKSERLRVHRIARAPNGRFHAVSGHSGADYVVTVWDAKDTLRTRFKVNATRPPEVAFAPHGDTLALLGAKQIHLHSLSSGAEQTHAQPVAGAGANPLVFVDDGATLLHALVYATVSRLRVLDMHTGLWRDVSDFPPNLVDMAPARDGSSIAVVGKDGTLTVCDGPALLGGRRLPYALEDKRKGVAPNRIRYLAYAPDGQSLVGKDSTESLWRWHPAQRTVERPLGLTPLPEKFGFRMLWSPDAVHVARIRSKEHHLAIYDARTGDRLREFKEIDLTKLRAVMPLGDGRHVACAGATQTELWDFTTGKLAGTFAVGADAVDGLHASADGRFLLLRRKTSRLLDVKSGKTLSLKLSKSAGGITPFVAFALDGRRVAIAGTTGVCIYDTADGREITTIQLFGYRALSVALSPDGRRLATTGEFGKATGVKLWDTATGQEVFTFDPHTSFTAAAFSPDGRHLAAATAGREPDEDDDPDAPKTLRAEIRIWTAGP